MSATMQRILLVVAWIGLFLAPASGQGPSLETVPLVPDSDNSTIVPATDFLDHAYFDRLGYHGYPLDSLFMIDSLAGRDLPLRQQPVAVACNAYDVVSNGTFFRSNPIRPITPIVRNGGLDRHDPDGFALRRGAVAVQDDGTILVGRADGLNKDAIRRRFGEDLREFTGGGVLLVEGRAKVELYDVVFQQYLQNRPSDPRYANLSWQELVEKKVWPDQCRGNTPHTLIGIRDGQAYLLVSTTQSCATMQTELLAEGFGTVVMFDGGRATYLRDNGMGALATRLLRGKADADVNFTGFGAYVRRVGGPSKATLCPQPPNRCGIGPSLSGTVTRNYEVVGACPIEPLSPLPVASTISDVTGLWSGTWERHDTHNVGGFSLEIARLPGGSLRAAFRGQEAKSVSRSGDTVTLILEPASGCQGARLHFFFADGEPLRGDYTVYGEGKACNRTGEYRFP